MIDNTHTGGAAFVRICTVDNKAFRAEAIRGTWNGWLVPAFTHSEAWAILTAHGFEVGDDEQMNIHYTDATGEVEYLTRTNDELYIFDGWTWESAEVAREVVDALTEFITTLWDMDLITGISADTLNEWLAVEAGEYANNTARSILDSYAGLVLQEIEDGEQMGMDDDGTTVFSGCYRIIEHMGVAR